MKSPQNNIMDLKSTTSHMVWYEGLECHWQGPWVYPVQIKSSKLLLWPPESEYYKQWENIGPNDNDEIKINKNNLTLKLGKDNNTLNKVVV